MEYRIVLTRMEFHALHGCYELERKVGNRFTVDLELTAELGHAATDDDEGTLLQVFEGVPQFRIARAELGLPFVDLCAEKTQVFPSKGECRKMVQGGGVSLNKEKVADPARTVGEADLIAGKYLLVQKGKKNYYLVIAE